MGDRLSGPLMKVERANHHVHELAALIQRFLDSDPYSISREDDDETGDEVFWVEVADRPDPMLGAVAGDIVHNLRSALDLLMWQLIEANGRTPGERMEFPIFSDPVFLDNAKLYESHVRRKVKGANEAAIRRIKSIQPYNAGYEALWTISLLDLRSQPVPVSSVRT